MDELSLHIIDIVQNSISAKANLIEIIIFEDSKNDYITIEIKDNGRGIEKDMLEKVQDSFYTTKTGKEVGFGIPLFKQIVLLCDGEFKIESKENFGTRIYAKFRKSHPNLPSIGDLENSFLTLIIACNCDFYIYYNKDGKIFEFDTKKIKNFLGGVPLNHPEVIKFLKSYFYKNFEKMEAICES